MKAVEIHRQANKDVVESLEHILKLAREGKTTGFVGCFKMLDGFTRKVVHGSYFDNIPLAIGDLETVKMWIYSLLDVYDVPPREDELKDIEDNKEKT